MSVSPNKFLVPNSTQVPNVLLDELMPLLGLAELKVMLVVVRQTYGWRKDSDKISLTTFERLTGLSRWPIVRAINKLGCLINVQKGFHGARPENRYSLNISDEALVKFLDQSSKLTSHSDQSSKLTLRKISKLKEKTRARECKDGTADAKSFGEIRKELPEPVGEVIDRLMAKTMAAGSRRGS